MVAIRTQTGQWIARHRTALVSIAILTLLGWVLWSISPPPDIHPPQSVDLPFDSLVGLRQAMLAQADNSAALLAVAGGVVLAVVGLFAWRGRRLRQAVSTAIAVGCGLVALQAQALVMRGEQELGVTLYVLAGTVFFVWARVTSRPPTPPAETTALLQKSGLPRRTEIVLLGLVLAVTVFGRFYELKRLPYGIDGDESKWTIEVVSVMVDGHDALSSEYHRRFVPVSFWLEAPFHWLLGAGLTPGRVEVALFSVVASFVFYRLVRELFDAPTALVATLLLAVALPDLTASRAGNVESHVKLWAILPFYGLAVSLRTRQVRDFLLTGFAVAGAMLTYETLVPIVAAVAVLALGAAAREWRQWRQWLRRLAALATAPVAVAAVTIDYLFGRLPYYASFRSATDALPLGDQLLRGVQGLLRPFYARPITDALFHRFGPLISGLLVPLIVLGILYALSHARRRGNTIALSWLAWAFIPVPLVLHSPFPRTLYPGIPVLHIFMALALVAIFRSVTHAVQRPRLTTAVGILVLSALTLLELTVWFQEIKDPDDEIRRREVAEIVAAQVTPAGPVWMPSFPFNETVAIEQDLMALTIRERRQTIDAGEFHPVPFDELLPLLSHAGAQYGQLTVLYDRSQTVLVDERQRIMDAALRCFSPATVAQTEIFSVYQIAQADLVNPACRSGRLVVIPPEPQGSDTPVAIAWSFDSTPAARADLACSRGRSDVVWLEAETFPELLGWISDTRFVTGWSGDGYLADDFPGEQYAATTIDIPQAGAYQVWVRSYRRQPDAFPAFVTVGQWASGANPFPGRIQSDAQVFPFGESEIGPLEAWHWQHVASLPLEAGTQSVAVTRPFNTSGTRYIALFVDAFVLTTDLDFNPGQDAYWQPVLQLPTPNAGAQSHGTFEASLDPGRYRCEVMLSDGDRLVDETGAVGITSKPIYFEVRP